MFPLVVRCMCKRDLALQAAFPFLGKLIERPTFATFPNDPNSCTTVWKEGITTAIVERLQYRPRSTFTTGPL